MRSYLKVVLSKVGYMLKRETEAQEVKYLILPESLVRDPVFRFPVVPPHYLQRLGASWEPAGGPPSPIHADRNAGGDYTGQTTFLYWIFSKNTDHIKVSTQDS